MKRNIIKTFGRVSLPALVAGAFACLAVVPASHGAAIDWFGGGGAHLITGNSDVVTNDATIGAFNVGDGGVPSVIVNGVNFQAFPLDSTSGPVSSGSHVSGGVTFTLATVPSGSLFASENTIYGSGLAPFTTLSTNYQSLLKSATMVPGPDTFTLTMSGLSVGQTYTFQWWVNFSAPGDQSHAATAVNGIVLQDNTAAVDGGLGQFAVGTFTADTPTQVITFSAVPNTFGEFAMVNAFQLRSVPCIPVITCQPDRTNEWVIGAVPVFGNPNVSDNCDTNPTITFVESELPATCPAVRIFRRTWTATDHSTNRASCSQTIAFLDTTPPVITCSPNQTNEWVTGAFPVFSNPTASDTCDTNLTITFVDDQLPATCPAVRIFRRTWTATDDCTNRASCSQTIMFLDTTPPVINCPSNVTVSSLSAVPPCPTNVAEFRTLPGASASDTCDTNLEYYCTDTTLLTNGCGRILRAHTVADDCTNTDSCLQIITVDCGPPKICVTKEVACELPTGCGAYSHLATGAKSSDNSQCPAFCYRVRVTNCGGENLRNVTVVDDVISLVGCNFPATLAVGQTVECILAGVTHCDSVTNTVRVSGVGASSGSNVTASATAAVEVRSIEVTCNATVNGQTNITILCDGQPHLITNEVQICNTGELPLAISGINAHNARALGGDCTNLANLQFSLQPGECTNVACVEPVTCYPSEVCSFEHQIDISITATVDSSTNACAYTRNQSNQVVAVTASSTCSATVILNADGIRPRVDCRPGVNPSGQKIPMAGKNPASGQNPDGYYQLLAKDNCDPDPLIYVWDTGSDFVAGPFHSGDVIKLTQSPGRRPSQDSAPPPIVAHLHFKGDGFAIAVDANGNSSYDGEGGGGCLMLVARPPK